MAEIKTWTEIIKGLSTRKDRGASIPTGYPSLDHRVGGLGKGELTVLASRYSEVASTLAGNIAIDAALLDYDVLLITSERMDNVAVRIISSACLVEAYQIRGASTVPTECSFFSALLDCGVLSLSFCDMPEHASDLSDVVADFVDGAERGNALVVVDGIESMPDGEPCEIAELLRTVARDREAAILATTPSPYNGALFGSTDLCLELRASNDLDLSEYIFDMCIVGPNENITQEYPGLVAKMGYVPEYPKVFELV